MKKAQIINKILNKILKEYNVIVQYFFYFGNKKREVQNFSFFLNKIIFTQQQYSPQLQLL